MLDKKTPDKLTKIVATVGPATFDPEVLKTIINSGVNVIRLNLSHGSLEEHESIIHRIRKVSAQLHREVAILLDLPGPKVRLGVMPQPLTVTRAHKVALVWQGKLGGLKGMVELPVPAAIKKVMKVKAVVAIDDGNILLRVKRVYANYASVSVIAGGEITSRKGIAVLGVDLPLAPLTVADERALTLAPLVDFVAVSFVRKAADLEVVRRKVKALVKKGSVPCLVAKIETTGAVDNIDTVIKATDAVMVARGDLALAVNPASLGVLQKMIVKKVRAAGKPVIVATQMLDSMTLRPLPTRAELLDVANAVIDHVDAVMLSGETASGKFPREAVNLMAQIADMTEKSAYVNPKLSLTGTSNSPSHLLVHILYDFITRTGVRLVINESGDPELMRLIARHRIEVKQVVPVATPGEGRQLNVIWGVFPVVSPNKDADIRKQLVVQKLVRKGEHVLAIGWHMVNGQKSAFARIEKV